MRAPQALGRKELFCGLVLALLVRLAFCLHTIPLDQKPLVLGDSYETIGVNLLQRSEYSFLPGHPTAMREPGYILLIAGVYRVFGVRPWAMNLTLVALSTATVWLIYGLAAAAFPGRGTRLVFWTAVFYPYFVYYNAYYIWFRETWLSFLAALMFLLLARRKDFPGALAAGTAAGWLCLSNFVWTPPVLLCGAWVFYWESPGAAARKRFAGFLLPIFLLMGCWTLRNWRVFGAFLPGSSPAGNQLYQAVALPPEILGTPEGLAALEKDPVWIADFPLPEAEQNSALTRASVRFIAEHPLRFLKDLPHRFFLPWHIVPAADVSYTHNARLVRLAALLTDGWILPLALFGLWRERKKPLAAATALLILTLTAAYSLTRAPIRYRVPLMPVLIVFMGCGARELIRDERIPI